MKKIFFLFILIIPFFANTQETVTDKSGNVYKTVKIGAQIWMAENLRTEKFNNGDPIEQITSNRYWQEVSFFALEDTTLKEIWPVMTYYDNEKQKNNALYNYYVVMDDRGVCPSSWHIPSFDEYEELINYLGGFDQANTKLKSTSSWKNNGTNTSGFNALAVGKRLGSGEFSYKNEETTFWTDDTYMQDYGDLIEINGFGLKINTDINSEKPTEISNFTMGMACSIRCLKN